MIKRFIELSAKWKYTWPAWGVVTIGILGTFPFGHTLYTLLYYSTVIIASAVLAAGRWQGCLFGIFNGFIPMAEYLYNCRLIEYRGMVIYHNRNPWPVTVAFTACYVFMGWLCYKENRTN